jgi:hypothetical protein
MMRCFHSNLMEIRKCIIFKNGSKLTISIMNEGSLDFVIYLFMFPYTTNIPTSETLLLG